jgi:hypothetical protein
LDLKPDKKKIIFLKIQKLLSTQLFTIVGECLPPKPWRGDYPVSFDLESLKNYYPQGMIKTSLGNHQQFADNIIALLSNIKLYQKTSVEALTLIKNVWDWHHRSQILYKQIFLV